MLCMFGCGKLGCLIFHWWAVHIAQVATSLVEEVSGGQQPKARTVRVRRFILSNQIFVTASWKEFEFTQFLPTFDKILDAKFVKC